MNAREIARSAVADHLGLEADDLAPDADLYDLGIDSLDAIEIVLDIEARIDGLLDDDQPRTLSDLEKLTADAIAFKKARAA
jgi:acyl carrier protein